MRSFKSIPGKLFLLLIYLLLFSARTSAQALVAWYPFDNSTEDRSGNNNDGRFYGGVKTTSDRFGNPCGALHFNGRNGYIEVASSPSLKSPVNTLTVTSWFKLDSTALTKGNKWLTLICKGVDPYETINNPQYRVQVYQSSFQSTISTSTNFTEYDTGFAAHRLAYNQWYFYALVFDGRSVRTYINSKLSWEFPYERIFFQNDEPMHIGKDIPGMTEYFSGALDDLRIYNTALTEQEINELHEANVRSEIKDTLSLACPENITLPNDPGKCYASGYINKASVDPGCGNTLRQTGGLVPGTKFPVGTSVLTYEARSLSGKKTICKVNVIVRDEEAPYFQCLRDTTLLIEDPRVNGVGYTYTVPVITDNCLKTQMVMAEGLPSGSLFPPGRTRLKFIAFDNAGNSMECSSIVYVTDKLDNTMINYVPDCPDDIITTSQVRRCGTIVNYSLPDKNHYVFISGKTSGEFYPVGTTVNKFKQIGANGTTTVCSFKVIVRDNENPVINCDHDTVIYCKANETSMAYEYNEPGARDNCGIDSLVRIQGLESGARFPLGTTPVIYKATDRAGNTTACTFSITVLDTNPAKVDKREKTVTKPYLKDKVHYVEDLKFKKCELTLVLYDDAEEDHDTVSVFFNGSEIVNREMIHLKRNGTIIRTVSLLPGQKNDFIVKAWNNGNVSPNTIRIEFYEGNYNSTMAKLQFQKPKKAKTLHSKPGVAGAISISCTGK